MHRLLPWLAVFLCAYVPMAQADAPPAARGFAFCTVTDTGSTPAKVWASPVVAVDYAAEDSGGFRRSLDLAGEFLEAVQARGGQGTKSCNVSATAQEAAQLRAETEATWNKRMFMIRIGDWREVAWTPKPWAPAAVPATVARYFLCSAMQTDLPERIAISRSVASGIIAREVPGDRALEATMALTQAYTGAFQPVVQAHGVTAQGSCLPYDSLAEVQYAQKQQRRLMDGFNQKYAEVAWEPSAEVTAAALAAPAASPSADAVAGAKVEAVTPKAPADHYYCVAGISRTSPAQNFETPVREVAGHPDDPAAMPVVLSGLLASLVRTAPDWHAFGAPTCYENAGVFAGEHFCFAAVMKRMRGVSQTAALFCNASREGIGQRVQDMAKQSANASVQSLAWPE